MANTKIQNLPIVGTQQVSSSGWYLYATDVVNFTDARIKATDFFTTISSSGVGKSLIASSTLNNVGIKTLDSVSPSIEIKDLTGSL